MSGPQPEHVRATLILPIYWTYPGLLSGSSKQYRTCLVNTIFTTTKSFCRTYPAGSSGSSNVSWTYPVPGSDMSGLLDLTRVKSRHRTCSILSLCSNNLFQTYPISWLDMSESLTPQQKDSCWGLKKEAHTPLAHLSTPLI
jgi:hypothetical protein